MRRARHVEVQILGDPRQPGAPVRARLHGAAAQPEGGRARAGALSRPGRRDELCEAALRLARAVNYTHAGTVEFLMDADTGKFYFIEVNPRIQVEHTVTEQVTGIDIVKAQIRITEGAASATPESGVPRPACRQDIRLNGHALQCRVTTEDPENGFIPDYGRITAYRSAAGFGIRLDGGTAYSGAVITPYYDSLLVKVTAWAPTPKRRSRAWTARCANSASAAWRPTCSSSRTSSPSAFRSGTAARPVSSTRRRSCSTSARARPGHRCCVSSADVTVNGNPEMKGRKLPALPLARPIRSRCPSPR
jgi:pyruvate carboxylase